MQKVSRSTSTSTGVAPVAVIAATVGNAVWETLTTSSPGPIPSACRTTLQPAVVEPLSDTLSAGTPICPASAARTVSRRASIRWKYSGPARPSSSSARWASATASIVARASGPNVPAFR